MPSHPVLFGIVALLAALAIVRVLARWSASDSDPFSIRDLLMENGRASKGAVVLMGAFAATTWMFVYYTLIGKMTEGYFGLYAAAWIAPVVARMITNANGSPAAAITTTTTTETKAVTGSGDAFVDQRFTHKG